MGAKIPHSIRSKRTEKLPVILRMDNDRIIQGFMEVKNGLQHLIIHFYKGKRLVYAFFIPSGNNGGHIADMTHVAVKDEPVKRAGIWICLSGKGKTSAVLRHVFPSENGFHAVHLHGGGKVDIPNYRVGVF